jgi:hypothetical protein
MNRISKVFGFLTLLLLNGWALPAQQSAKPKREFALRAESPEFWKLFARDAKLEMVSTGFGFTEGPVWDPKGFVYVSDEEINKIDCPRRPRRKHLRFRSKADRLRECAARDYPD